MCNLSHGSTNHTATWCLITVCMQPRDSKERRPWGSPGCASPRLGCLRILNTSWSSCHLIKRPRQKSDVFPCFQDYIFLAEEDAMPTAEEGKQNVSPSSSRSSRSLISEPSTHRQKTPRCKRTENISVCKMRD